MFIYVKFFLTSRLPIELLEKLKKVILNKFYCRNIQDSRKAMWLICFLFTLLWITTCFSGLAIYSKYYNCDPLLQKRITLSEMLMPLYVMDTMSNIPGLAGIFVAGNTFANRLIVI